MQEDQLTEIDGEHEAEIILQQPLAPSAASSAEVVA
jgi:hypothetical protein